jgi:hypothetical protein
VGLVTQWRGQPDTSNRRLRWLVLASLLGHAPFTPLVALIGLFGWLAAKNAPPIDAPPLTAIPVDLIEGEDLGAAAPPPPPPPAVESTEPIVAARKPKLRPEPADAGIPDAGAPDAEPADAGPTADAGPSDAGTGVDGGAPNPMAALSGDAKKVVDPDSNVRLVVYPERIRNHPLGPRIGRMLGSIYQWRDFFGPSKLDPIRDVDRIMIVGPELRDSSKVAAILKLNVGPSRVREAIDAIVKADTEHGEWLDAGIPAATAYADRAPRIFAMPSPNIVVVVPPTAKEAVLKLPKNLSIRKAVGPEVLWAYAVNPWRPARMLRLDLPKTIRSAQVWVTPTEGGGALVEAEGEDESPDAAERDAAAIMALINQNLALADTIGSILGGVLGVQAPKLVEKVELHAEGSKIRGSALLTEQQIELIFSQLEPLLTPRRTPRIPPPPLPSATP